MKLNLKCLPCNINQTLKITELIKCDEETKKIILSDVFELLKNVDYEYANPHTMKYILEIISKHTNNNNPYKDVKKYYNNILLEEYSKLKSMITESDNVFECALKAAILGNIIDFGPAHNFDKDIIFNELSKLNDLKLTIDNSVQLQDSLSEAKTLLYIGDNCGEIVLDKLFIEIIKSLYPNIEVTFAVRGMPALNDVTVDDANDVGMNEIAKIIDSGDGCPGTILNSVSKEFKETFNSADVIIAKGQGNYEGLSDEKSKKLFLLFMAKCDVVASIAGVKKMSIVCLQN